MTSKHKRKEVGWKDDPDPEPNLMHNSKKIQKRSKPDSPVKKKQSNKKMDTDNDNTKENQGYDTFSPQQKVEILTYIKDKLIDLEDLQDSDFQDPLCLDWNEHLKELGFQMFNEFLEEIIPFFKPYLELNTERLTKLRKQIKGWFDKESNIETRGKPLILESDMPEFIEIVKEIIRLLPSRSFEALHEKVTPRIQSINAKANRVFEGTIFSKHYWWEFYTQHTEILKLWRQKPRNLRALEEISTEASTEDWKSESPTSVSFETTEIIESENIETIEETQNESDIYQWTYRFLDDWKKRREQSQNFEEDI